MRPLAYFSFHSSEVEDISYNHFHDSLLASCDDDGHTVLWDTRTATDPIFSMRADNSPLYSVQFAPLDRHLLATAGADAVVKLWDIRNLSESLLECQ